MSILLHFIFIFILCFNGYVSQVDDPSIVVDKDADSYLGVPRMEERDLERISALSSKRADLMFLLHSLKANGHNFSLSQHKVRAQIPW